MAKFHGSIGFDTGSMSANGIYTETITEREYIGDFLRNSKSWENGQSLNDNLTLSTRVSIVSDPFAYANLPAIKYVKWEGIKWKVTRVELERPRLIMTVGDVYNG